MKKEDIVVCPVYNEEENLEKFYADLRRNYKGGTLFVNDGSTDKSKEFLSKLKNKNTFLVNHSYRKGYGATLIKGFNFALRKGFEKVVTIDTDLQHSPKHIENFFCLLSESDIVLGSRYIRITDCSSVPLDRKIINRYISGIFSKLFGVDISDPFCGYRGYTKNFLNQVCLKEKSYGLSIEILLEAIRLGELFKEVAVEIVYRQIDKEFLDNLNNPRERLLYYLEIISKKLGEIKDEEKVFVCKPTS